MRKQLKIKKVSTSSLVKMSQDVEVYGRIGCK